MNTREKTTFEKETDRAMPAESDRERRIRLEAHNAFFAALAAGAAPGELFNLAYGAGLTSREHIIRDRDHSVWTSAADAQKLRKFLDQPNGSCTIGPDDRVSVNAVVGGGVHISTKPYRSRAGT